MYEGKDELTILQEDVKRALKSQKPNWAMLIDLRRCVLCHACTVACISEQKSPPGIAYRPVYEEEMGEYPKVKRRFTPRPCQQCDKPPCVGACPNAGENNATWKSQKGESHSIVMQNYEACIGCGKCVAACPYKARTLDSGSYYTENTPRLQEYEKGPTFEYSKKWVREPYHIPVGVARKCHFCLHRLRKGMLPMCVSTCISRANYFGDPTDTESLIYKVMQKNKVMVLTGVKGDYPGKIPTFDKVSATSPRVYYIVP